MPRLWRATAPESAGRSQSVDESRSVSSFGEHCAQGQSGQEEESPRHAGGFRRGSSSIALQDGQQPQDLDVEPHQGDGQPERNAPRGLLRRAFVELKPGAAKPDDAEVFAFCKSRLARFKVPKTLIFGPLPKTSTGKIQKFLLRDQAKSLEKA